MDPFIPPATPESPSRRASSLSLEGFAGPALEAITGRTLLKGLGVGVLLLIVSSLPGLSDAVPGLPVLMFLGFMSVVVWLMRKEDLRLLAALRQRHAAFAQDNGFRYDEQLSEPEALPGLLFSQGFGGQARHIVSGTLEGLPFRFFRFTYKRRSGKNTQTIDTSVWEFALPRTWPRIVINSRLDAGQMAGMLLPEYAPGLQEVDMGEEFNRYFRIQTEPGRHLEVLALLTPDVMQSFLRQVHTCDVEIVGDRLYLYWPHRDATKEGMAHMTATIEELFRELGSKLRRENAPLTQEAVAAAAIPPTESLVPTPQARPHSAFKWGVYVAFALFIVILLIPTVPPEAAAAFLIAPAAALFWAAIPLTLIIVLWRRSRLAARHRRDYNPGSTGSSPNGQSIWPIAIAIGAFIFMFFGTALIPSGAGILFDLIIPFVWVAMPMAIIVMTLRRKRLLERHRRDYGQPPTPANKDKTLPNP